MPCDLRPESAPRYGPLPTPDPSGYRTLRQADLAHLWHPFTHIDSFEQFDFPIISHGRGAWLYDVRGQALMDGISSWWCVNLGHGNPGIVEAIRTQAGQLQHSILGGMSHPAVIRLAAKLAACPPRELNRVYFCGDGASATEAAMRMAIEYWHHRGRPEKKGVIALADAYHGDTRGAVAAGYVDAFHAPLRHSLPPARQAESPHCFACEQLQHCQLRCFASMADLIKRYHAETAAVIVEPRCQGAGGMRIYPAAWLIQLRTLCDAHDILLIADEIAVGFGRSGRLFACETADIVPDLMCLGKGLTGGTLPMSAVRCRQHIVDAFRKDTHGQPRTFYHGHTFAGNPIASAAALAALDQYLAEGFFKMVARNADCLSDGFKRFAAMPGVAHTRTLGMMSALQVGNGNNAARSVARRALQNGLLIRPLGDILYLWPPLNIDRNDLERMLDRFESALSAG